MSMKLGGYVIHHLQSHIYILIIQHTVICCRLSLWVWECCASFPPLPGGPGSGKGTQCARVVSEFNFAHLSTGNLLRGEVEKGSPLGRELEETMRQGKLVPSVSCLNE